MLGTSVAHSPPAPCRTAPARTATKRCTIARGRCSEIVTAIVPTIILSAARTIVALTIDAQTLVNQTSPTSIVIVHLLAATAQIALSQIIVAADSTRIQLSPLKKRINRANSITKRNKSDSNKHFLVRPLIWTRALEPSAHGSRGRLSSQQSARFLVRSTSLK